ncbi:MULTISPECIES: hypothetical protein [unclassified Streptomyces]|nr:hypothetical protein OG457_47830 [Streptomyces sp. NBC_01207]WTA16636.1 hypothetical protein OG365_00260 [Streptomyces sp. NBC_00853]
MGNSNGDLIYGPEKKNEGGTATVRSRLTCNWQNDDDALCSMKTSDDAIQDRFRVSTW